MNKLWATAAAASLAILAMAGTQASAQQPTAVLTCDNGHSYRLQPRAISQDGDLVTGYLLHGPTRIQYLRLIPVGYGYRYAGAGVWLDGHGDRSTLNFGLGQAVDCTVGTGS